MKVTRVADLDATATFDNCWVKLESATYGGMVAVMVEFSAMTLKSFLRKK
jgi:hypothetical protein